MVLGLDQQLLSDNLLRDNARLTVARDDMRSNFGKFPLDIQVRIELIPQTAFQSAASTRNFGRVQRRFL